MKKTSGKNKKKLNMEFNKKNTQKKILSTNMTPKKFEKENFKPGDILTVKITSLGSKNIGVAELKNGTTLLVPNTNCGEKVQVKIEKVFRQLSQTENGDKTTDLSQKKKVKYAIASIYPTSSKEKNLGSFDQSFPQKDPGEGGSKTSNSVKFDFKVGQKLKVTIQKKGPKNSGFVPVSKNFLIIVPNAKVGEKLIVEILKIKQNYAFAKPIFLSSDSEKGIGSGGFQHESHEQQKTSKFSKHKMIGQEFYIELPFKTKTFGNYFVVKFHETIVFVKKGLGVQAGDRVQIQIQKATEKFALAKVQQISPIPLEEKKFQVKEKLQKMIQSSMHFGEKVISCNANMRKYIWYRKKGLAFSSQNQLVHSPTLQQNRLSLPYPPPKKRGVHTSLSHQRPFVKRGRHFFNLFKTQGCLNEALKQLAKYAAKGKTFLFVGTKKPAASLIAKAALLSNTSFFVNTRWLGGMLTNWKTILKSIAQIRPILKQKEKILQKIFEKRQKIQRRLFQKVSLLQKKSKKFLNKGKHLIHQILNLQNFRIEKIQKLMQKKNALLAVNLSLVNSSKKLKMKKLETLQQIQELEIAAQQILEQKNQVKVVLSTNMKKFKDYEQLLQIGQEFLKIQTSFGGGSKENQTKFVALSYEKFEKIHDSDFFDRSSIEKPNSGVWSIPNPSPEIFKKIISLLTNFGSSTGKENSENAMLSFVQKTKLADSNRSKNQKASGSNQTILLSKFLKKFFIFLPILQASLKNLKAEILHQQKMYEQFQKTFGKILALQNILKEIYKKTVEQFSFICSKFSRQRKNFKVFQTSFRQFAAEQRLLKFLPKLRYLPTSQTKMYETLELFMKKFVDPKFIYPMEQIYDQKLKFTSKKIATTRKQKWQRLEKYFGGITKMAKMNTKQISKNVAIIVGQQEEMSAVHECRKLGMKIFAIVDTNCDPKYVDHIIPANDDSRNSIHYILGEMLTYIRLGQKLRKKVSFRAKFQQNTKKKKRFDTRFLM